MVDASIASLNVAEIRVFTATPVAPLAGTVEITVGGGVFVAVNVQTTLAARPAPVRSLAPVVIVAVYRVPLVRFAAGVNVAVVPAYVIMPATAVVPGPASVKVAALMVAAFMAALNVAETGELTNTPTAPLIGTVETTVGGGAVVNIHGKSAASG